MQADSHTSVVTLGMGLLQAFRAQRTAGCYILLKCFSWLPSLMALSSFQPGTFHRWLPHGLVFPSRCFLVTLRSVSRFHTSLVPQALLIDLSSHIPFSLIILTLLLLFPSVHKFISTDLFSLTPLVLVFPGHRFGWQFMVCRISPGSIFHIHLHIISTSSTSLFFFYPKYILDIDKYSMFLDNTYTIYMDIFT